MSLVQEGYLFKRGDVLAKWNLRYFMLFVGSQPTLVYYRKVGEAPANALPLIGAKVQISGTAKGGSLFRFTVQASGETYELAANTQQERRRWVDQLLQASSRLPQPSSMPSPSSNGANGHLLAPSPLGARPSSDDREAWRGSPPLSPSPLRRRSSLTQEAAPSVRPQGLCRDLLDSPGAQLPSPSVARRAGQPMGSRSPTKGRMGMPEPGRGSDSDSLRSFSMRSPSGSVKRSLLASLSASFRNAVVPPRPSDMASSLSDTESLDTMGLGPPSSPYTANLQPLRGQGPESPKAAALALDALLEQFERAQQYVARHPEDFSLDRLSSLQDWCDAAKSKGRVSEAGLAAAAMYVLQVTQASPMWASEHDTAFISPEGMIRSVQSCPGASSLADLKDCLDFCSNSWVSLFCRQGGAALLLQALEVHGGAAGDAEGHEAMLATLQCMHALMSGTSGMRGVLDVRGFPPGICALLARPGEPEAAKLVVEMLIKLCLFSAEGYTLAVKTLLGRLLPAGEPAQQPSPPKAAQSASGQGTGADAAARSAPSSPPQPPRPPGAGSKPFPKPGPAPCPPPPPPPPRPPGSGLKPSLTAASPPPPPPPPPRPPGSGQRPPAPRLAFPAPPPLPPLQHTPASGQASSPTTTSEQPRAAGGAAAQRAGRGSSSAGHPNGTTYGAAQPSGALAQGSKSAEPGSAQQQDSAGINGASTASPASDEDKKARENAPEYCTAILTLLKTSVKVTADMELADHLLSFLNAALSSPEAEHAVSLLKAFVHTLLDLGLLNVLADISGMLDPYMDASVHLLRAHVKEVIAVPKPEPLPVPKVAPPAPPPPRPARPSAPPPPPPGGRKGPAKPLAPAKPLMDPGPKPSRKLKAFFWDVLPDSRVPGTFWEANGPAYSSLDTQEVEELFQAAQVRKLEEKKPAIKQLAILDVKRATGIGIRMAGLRAPWGQVAEAVRRLDTRILASADDARAVLACVPAAEERKMFEAFLRSGGAAAALSDAERFCLELMQVPRIEERLGTYAASFEAEQQVEEAAVVAASHVAAQAELRASACFRAALARALALGNFLNWGSRLGGAAGFRLKNLPKLQDTRAADGRNNMLRYLGKRLVSEEPPQAVLSTEIPTILSAPLKTSLVEALEMLERASISLAQIRAELQRAGPSAQLQLLVMLEGGSERVHVTLQCDSYSDVMATSAQSLSGALAKAKEQLQSARSGFAALVAYFGENPAAFSNDGDFWRDVTAFVALLSAAQQDAVAFEQEQRARAAQQQAKSRGAPAGARQPSNSRPPAKADSSSADASTNSAEAAAQGLRPTESAPTAQANATERSSPMQDGPQTQQSSSKAVASGKAEAVSRIPVHADSSNKPRGRALSPQRARLKQERAAELNHIEARASEQGLIQALPESPTRKASKSWQGAKVGLSVALPPSAGDGDVTNGASEADLEALLGQLVTRAGHI